MSELDLWNEMGNMYYFAGAYDEAIRTYTKVIRIDPGYAQSYTNLASILVTQGRHAEALPVFRKAIELTNEKISRAFLWKQLGDAYRELNDHTLASDAYRNAIQLVPEDASLRESLAEMDLAAQVHPSEPLSDSSPADGSPIRAEAVAAGSLDMNAPLREQPEPLETEAQAIPEIDAELASNLPDGSLDGEPGNACWMFMDKEEAAQSVPGNSTELPEPCPVVLGGRLLEDVPTECTAGETPESLTDLEAPAPEQASVQDSPAETSDLACDSLIEEHTAIDQPESGIFGNVSPQALLRLGILHRRAEEYERAIRFLEYARVAACRARDQFLQALCHYATARLQTDMGKIEAAIRSYQSAANLAPERIFPWSEVANLTCRLGRYEDARAAFQEAIEHNPKDPIAWNGLGDVYHKLGRFEDAIAAYQLGNVFEGQAIDEDVLKTFERSIDSDQNDPLVWNEAGDIYFRLDAFADAVASYRKAVQLDPGNPSFQANLTRARQVLEEVNGKNEPSDSGVLNETDQDTLPLPKNFLDEMVSPKPEETIVIDTHPGTHLRVEPFILETDSPQPAQPYRILPVSTTSQPIQSAGFVLEQAPDQSEPPAPSETGVPSWMVKEVQPRGNPGPSGSCYLPAITETLVRSDLPLPAIEVRTPYKPAFSGAQVLTEADQEHINVLVQMTPRPPRPSWSDEVINTPAVEHTWGKASLDEDAISRRTSLADSQSAVPDRQFAKPGSRQAEPVPPALHSKGSDIAASLRVTEINPLNDRAWDALGNKYEAAGLFSEAISAYEQAIVLSPQKEVYYYHLGIALAYQMHYDKAIQALEKVLTLNPKYILAHCALAGYYRKLGRETDAKIHVAIARPSMETENEYNQACFESISGDADRALELLELAFEKKQVQPGMIQNDPDLDFIRTDPRFAILLARNGIFNQ